LPRIAASNNHRSNHRPQPPLAGRIDRHVLYEAAVQAVDADLMFFDRISRKHRGKPVHTFTEDFCGTAVMACSFVKGHPENRAWGIDLHAPTLDWCRRYNFPVLKKDAERVTLIEGDVLHTERPKVDLTTALNFSYSVFKTRDAMRSYFTRVRRSLVEGGFFVLDAFGGTETMGILRESRRIPAGTAFDGRRVPSFTYVWEQELFNTIDHHIVCHIGFKFRDGSRRERAFTYDWRLWTLPELQELLLEAGFARSEVYMEGWDERANEADGIFRRRKTFDNQEGWISYVVGYC
jgi:cyclopropane fatty-acyl-phospholipid synthase-like methyltransferase